MFSEEVGRERKRRKGERIEWKNQKKEKIVKNQIKIISLTEEWTFFFLFFILFLNWCFPISYYFLNYFCLLNRFFFFFSYAFVPSKISAFKVQDCWLIYAIVCLLKAYDSMRVHISASVYAYVWQWVSVRICVRVCQCALLKIFSSV